MDGMVVRGTAIRVGDVAGTDAKVGVTRVGAAEGMSTVTTVARTAVARTTVEKVSVAERASMAAEVSTVQSTLTVDSMAAASTVAADAGKR
jgi:hypothetical protein